MIGVLNQFCKYFTSTFLTYNVSIYFTFLWFICPTTRCWRCERIVIPLYHRDISCVLGSCTAVLGSSSVMGENENVAPAFFAGILNCCIFMFLTSILYDFRRRACFTFMLQTWIKQYFIFSLVNVLKFRPLLTSLIWFLNNRTSPVNLNYEDYFIIYVNYYIAIQLPMNVLQDWSNSSFILI